MAARLDDFVSEHGRRPSPRPARKPARRRGMGRIVVAAVTTVYCLARAFARRTASELRGRELAAVT